jgi:flagellar motor component MotA
VFDKLIRNIVPAIFGAGLILIIAFLGVLALLGRDPEAYIGSITTLIGVIVSSGLIAALQTRVAKNTNGNTTQLVALVREAVAAAQVAQASASTRETVAPALDHEDTLTRIEADAARLPSHRTE